ncbi:hypothetical protein [Nocardia wallacei]|uniref:hypothetical protein n=1 Tax=Nocardia wallacei TaxID=480035 RepID=UPI002458543F|nr:hypothetical protein [Nocardia wallacei]
MRIVQPSVPGFRSYTLINYPAVFRSVQRDPLLDKVFAEAETCAHIMRYHRVRALLDLCCALTTQGVALADLTPSALLHYSYECRRHAVTPGARGKTNRIAGNVAWELLHTMGHFPPSTPPTLRAFVFNPQPTVEQLIDRYRLRSPEIRQLLIDYLTRRMLDSDHRSLDGPRAGRTLLGPDRDHQSRSSQHSDHRPDHLRAVARNDQLVRERNTPQQSAKSSDDHPRLLRRPAQLGRRVPADLGAMGGAVARFRTGSCAAAALDGAG